VTPEPLVTVCVPAYRSERYIAHTLAALQAQTFRDFRVRIGLEPIEEGPVVDVCRPFLADPRFELIINERQLGWDGNVAGLMAKVRTPMFCVQPHDDVPRPDYLHDLVGLLRSRPDATVAYSDVLSFGAAAGRRSNVLPDAPLRSERELGFFLAGAEGHPFRGVTRSTLLTRPFSSNVHRGFAVETEWALHLVQQGVALRSPRVLYLKRQPARTEEGSVTVGWRFGMSPEEQVAALEHNRSRLLDAIGPEEPGGVARHRILLAAEAAMLRRWTVVPGEPLPFGPLQLARARAVLDATALGASSETDRVSATVHVALSRHHAALGDLEVSLDEARRAVERAPADKDACLHLGQLLVRSGRNDEAVDLLSRAAQVMPLDDGVLRLLDVITRVVEQRYPAVASVQEAGATPR
jgi:hypothetical protein